MTAYNVDPVNHTAPTVIAKAFGPVPAGFEWSVNVRVCNVGGSDDTVDLRLQKSDGSNQSYRAKGHPVTVGGGTFDLEVRLPLPAGYEIWDRCSGSNTAVSYTATQRSTA